MPEHEHHGGKKKSEKREVDCFIGPSTHNHRRVHCPGIHKVDHVPINFQESGWPDKFKVEVKKGEHFDVIRTDHNAGWGQALVLRCRVRGEGKPVVTPDAGEKKSAWDPIEGTAHSIAIDSQGNSICCAPDGQIFERAYNAQAWTKIDGAATHVARGADGATWCVNASQQIYRREGSVWKQMPGAAVFITVGSASQVVAINAGMNIYKWNVGKNVWDLFQGAAVTASIAADGTFFVVNKAEEVFKQAGTGFAKVHGAARYVTVIDKSKVFILTSNNQVFKSTDEGANWQPVEGNLRLIAGSPGHLVGANASHQLYHQHI